ncbi:MAG: pyridoxal phosphate-dependent aminotransferase [Deltaproteobacteria bacterium]|nr:pyridoxal phosphate-dependent aminotransferase [Deltaproteobacteria bacterium]
MFSHRTSWNRTTNRLSLAVTDRRQRGLDVVDLGESNPTRVGLSPAWRELGPLLDCPQAQFYAPEPFGLGSARQAVADYLGGRVPAEQVLLSASTSEAYAWILQILCNPGDVVLVPAPSYPLLEYLAALAAVELRTYPALWVGGEWHIDLASLTGAIDTRTRAVVVVSPNNPTGSVASPSEIEALQAICAERGLALAIDEVFAEWTGAQYGDPPATPATLAGLQGCLTLVMSGLSKVLLLPQLKLAWTAVSGPPALVDEALHRLEIVADTSLSLATPVQWALPQLLGRRTAWQAPLRRRLRENRAILDNLCSDTVVTALPAQGGWSAVLRVPATEADDERALRLLQQRGILLQPGYFFDFPGDGWLVLGLLQPPERFEPAVAALLGDAHTSL